MIDTIATRVDAAIVFFKGADSALMPLAPPDDTTKAIAHNVHEFASSGLRTLVFASRTVDGMDVASLTDAAKRRASGDCPDSGRDVLVRGLEGGTPISILGATGVEDRLQSGVADCLSMLFRAGMRIWMVTGDKDETAVAVGHSCGLLTTHSNPRPDETPNGPLQQQHVLSVDGTTADECLDQITQHRRALKKQGLWNPATVIPTIAIVLNGFALEAILSAPNEIPTGHLMDLIVQARSVIACRLSPVQKASLVELVKLHHPRNVTLAIGDGGNDVPMIHTAHIGVGLYGNAGLLAARASDVAIARFQLLLRLLLLHGRWNHRRIMHVVLFTLYKGIALTTTLGLFSFFTGFSGQSLFDSYLIVGWTVVYTLAPVLVVGVVDQDITAPTILAYPAIYQEMEPINARKVLLWVASAALHSSIILYTVAKSIRSSALEAGGVVYVGTVVFAAHLLAATVKAAMTMHRWHRWQPVHVASLMLGPVLFVLFVAIFSHRYGPWPGLHVARDIAGVGEVMVSDAPTLFLVVFVVVPASVLPDVAFFGFQRLYFYSNRHVLQEIDSCLGSTRPRRSGTKTQAVAPCPDTPAPIVLAPDTPATASTSSNWPASPFPPPEEAPMPSQPVVAPPSECAILIALLQRLHATHRADPEDNVLAATDTKMHPTKMEFVGKQRVALEREFDASAVHHELRRVRVYVYVAACLMLVSLLVEYFVTSVAAHPDTQQLPLGRVDAPAHVASVRQAVAPTQGRFMTPFLVSRLTIVVLALAYAQATRTSMFAKHYHVAILVPMAVTGVVISATITVTGYVSAVLFPIVVLTMLHVRFTAALIVVLVNFAIYLVLQVFGDDSVLSATELGAFTCYIALVVGLAAHGCWRMQYAMRVDFLQHRALAMEEFRAVHILRNMFPPHVMAKLKAGDAIISEEEPDVTVLFCDIVDLHAFMRDHAPAEVVALLDHIYSLFDEVAFHDEESFSSVVL
ncbi:hypothetical protein DYB32_000712 [Aphanomyces invadans]|uniref:Guanylate cyclase domain-containing protein n=1 Tax=Aphanomyces invadans TaxID=157072 RepID=A0A418B911_9STRA|nr:hypothetical protein DYB32_000712 [Aphanomyces invadans]